MSDIVQQNQSYRRGLILGLTIAESVVLIIFALLLILTTLVVKKEREFEALQNEYKALENKFSILRGTIKFNGIDELMAELLALRDQAKQLTEKVVALEAELRQQRQRAESAESQLTELEKVRQLVEQINQQITGDQSTSEKLAVLVERAAAWERLTQQIAPNQPMKEVEQQIANYIGRGTERPACWVTPDGKPEYIFDIELHASGVVVHDNALSHRKQAQQQLPLGSFVFGREISFKQFRLAAGQLHEWAKQERAEQKSCVFFVRVLDRTPSNQKALYKNRLRIVGEYFYYYEPP